jgi:hypothetical protein
MHNLPGNLRLPVSLRKPVQLLCYASIFAGSLSANVSYAFSSHTKFYTKKNPPMYRYITVGLVGRSLVSAYKTRMNGGAPRFAFAA